MTLEFRRACTLQARVNDRWALVVVAPRGMHPDAESLVKWAADKLAVHLPRRTTHKDQDEPTAPPGGDDRGGSGGGAEIGIPVWWARKARS